VLKAIVERNGLDPGLVDDVIMGCVMQVGEQALNVGRNAVLAAGWPERCPPPPSTASAGRRQQAAHFAAQGVIAGAYDIVVAAGVEVMTRVPMGASVATASSASRSAEARRPLRRARAASVPQGISAEMIADEVGPHPRGPRRLRRRSPAARPPRPPPRAASRTRSSRSRPRSSRRRQRSRCSTMMVTADEGIRARHHRRVARQPQAGVQPRGRQGHRRQLVADHRRRLGRADHEREKAAELGLTPRARFHTFALAGVDPVTMMLTGPIPATRKVLERAGLTIDDIDLTEINEAFASVVLAWQKELHPDMDKVNVNGGAIALGHPLGCSGTKLMATCCNELERTGGRYGLQTMCEGGGMANATIIERLGSDHARGRVRGVVLRSGRWWAGWPAMTRGGPW
jgi:acetyl-CoA acyltransferase